MILWWSMMYKYQLYPIPYARLHLGQLNLELHPTMNVMNIKVSDLNWLIYFMCSLAKHLGASRSCSVTVLTLYETELTCLPIGFGFLDHLALKAAQLPESLVSIHNRMSPNPPAPCLRWRATLARVEKGRCLGSHARLLLATLCNHAPIRKVVTAKAPTKHSIQGQYHAHLINLGHFDAPHPQQINTFQKLSKRQVAYVTGTTGLPCKSSSLGARCATGSRESKNLPMGTRLVAQQRSTPQHSLQNYFPIDQRHSQQLLHRSLVNTYVYS